MTPGGSEKATDTNSDNEDSFSDFSDSEFDYEE